MWHLHQDMDTPTRWLRKYVRQYTRAIPLCSLAMEKDQPGREG
jgi:hypothetical protein